MNLPVQQEVITKIMSHEIIEQHEEKEGIVESLKNIFKSIVHAFIGMFRQLTGTEEKNK